MSTFGDRQADDLGDDVADGPDPVAVVFEAVDDPDDDPDEDPYPVSP
jgi:hypothetical protein